MRADLLGPLRAVMVRGALRLAFLFYSEGISIKVVRRRGRSLHKKEGIVKKLSYLQISVVLLLAGLVALGGCSGGKKISRIDTNTVILEKKINMVCELAEKDPLMQDLMIDLALGARSISKIRMDLTKRMIRHYPLKALRLLF